MAPKYHLVKLFYSKNQSQCFLLYLAIVTFCGCQGSCYMHDRLFRFIWKNVWDHCTNSLAWGIRCYNYFLSWVKMCESELIRPLTFSKDCWQSNGQDHFISFVSSLLSGDLIWCREGRKLPLWLTSARNERKLLTSDRGGMHWTAATLAWIWTTAMPIKNKPQIFHFL